MSFLAFKEFVKMKLNIKLIFLLIFSYASFVNAQIRLKKSPSQSESDFIKEFSDTLTLYHPVIKAKSPDGVSEIYLIFTPYKVDDWHPGDLVVCPQIAQQIVALSLMRYDDTTNYMLVIDTLQFYNGAMNPFIDTVFFANCDVDRDKEMFVLLKGYRTEKDRQIESYTTFVYNLPTKKNLHWEKDNLVSEIFKDSEGNRKYNIDENGHRLKGKIIYHSVVDILKYLKQMGY